jgi:hypothetical protein
MIQASSPNASEFFNSLLGQAVPDHAMKWLGGCVVSALIGCSSTPRPRLAPPDGIAIKVIDNDQATANEAAQHCQPYRAFMYRLAIEGSDVVAHFRCEG